jgi:hypothetical protein
MVNGKWASMVNARLMVAAPSGEFNWGKPDAFSFAHVAKLNAR